MNADFYYRSVVVVYNNLLVTLVTQKCFVNNGLADKTSTEPGLGRDATHTATAPPIFEFRSRRLDPNKNLSACSCMVRMIVLCNILSSSHQYHHISQNITSGVVQRPRSISATLTDF